MDARTLARELLAMSQPEFSAAFRGSPTQRAKLRGRMRSAAVVLGNAGTVEDVAVLEQAPDDPEPFVREHAAWALRRLGTSDGPASRCPAARALVAAADRLLGSDLAGAGPGGAATAPG